MYHIPVLLHESIEGLNIKPTGNYVDVTFGGGGHSREILKNLTGGRLLAFDQDADSEANKIAADNFIFAAANFRFLSNFLRYHEMEKVDGILADLGVSWHQFDAEQRGFSFRFDSELDMRMNQSAKLTAKQVVNEYTDQQLITIFREYGEIQNAFKLVQTIVNARSQGELVSTKQLVEAIRFLIPKQIENKYLAQVFQALRIEVNQEIENLKRMLLQCVDSLNVGGRLVVISYHSLEDRLVKNFMRSGNFEGELEKDFYGNVNCPFEQISRKVIFPSELELKENPRARSAKLRIAEKK